MSSYPHRFARDKRPPGGGGCVACRCGKETSGWLGPDEPAPETWGSACPAALREALDAARAEVAWYEERNGTRAEQEAEDAETEADLAAIDALTDDQVRAMNEAEGLDTPAARERFNVFLRVLTRETIARAKLADVTAERDRIQAILDAETGKRGPDGWLWAPHDTWSRYAGQGAPGPSASVWRHADQNGVDWSWRIDRERRGTAKSALEAMEAADLAAKETK